ncbi:MAG TPA: aliphatic sulfonate ABC transporter substrate-binding protein [Actinocrinis sp.]|nr:aliphatic sulfonate ABC transporter substrate-binding protein [Actinocrinis sp.]
MATILAACASSPAVAPLAKASDPSAASHPEWSQYTFTIGDNGGDGSEDLAKITGAFANAPYKVKFARFTYGPPLVQAAASGDIDLGSVGDVPPITGAAQEYGFKIVAVQHSLTPTQSQENILVPKGSSIQTLADLKGKKIAVPQGSSAHGLVLNALKSVGLTPQDVQLVFLAPAAGASAFATGKVDAWAIWNPQSAIAVEQGARVLAKGLPPIDQVSNYYVASDKTLNDPVKRAALTDLLERLAGEFAYGVAHPDQYAQAISQEDGISLTDAKAALAADESRVTTVLPSDITAEQQLSDAFRQADQITKQVDITSIVDNILPTGFDSSKLGSTG